MSEHTHGPWEATVSTGHHIVQLHDGRVGAYCGYVGAEDDAESAANARLIAAAPELLEALLEIDARLRRCAIEPISAAEAYDSFYQEIVAEAISKATGSAE